jgi:antitoxin HicB
MAVRAALHLAMAEAGLDGAQLAARLGCEEREIRRLLDPRAALNLPLIERALAGLGRRLALRLIEGQAA